MFVDIPIYDCTTLYHKGSLSEYNGRVYVCDTDIDSVGEFRRSDWYSAVVDVHITDTLFSGLSVASGYHIRCVLVPDNFEIMSFSEFSEDSIIDKVLEAVQNIADRFSIRNIYVGKYGTYYIRTKLEEIGYNVHLGPHNGETYIDRVVRLTSEKTGLKGEKLVRLYALLALVKGEDVTLEDVHDAWAMDMNFKEKNPPYCYGHDHHSLVPFDQLSKETQERDHEYVDAIKDVARILKDMNERF